jgi:hypothetical protein
VIGMEKIISVNTFVTSHWIVHLKPVYDIDVHFPSIKNRQYSKRIGYCSDVVKFCSDCFLFWQSCRNILVLFIKKMILFFRNKSRLTV